MYKREDHSIFLAITGSFNFLPHGIRPQASFAAVIGSNRLVNYRSLTWQPPITVWPKPRPSHQNFASTHPKSCQISLTLHYPTPAKVQARMGRLRIAHNCESSFFARCPRPHPICVHCRFPELYSTVTTLHEGADYRLFPTVFRTRDS